MDLTVSPEQAILAATARRLFRERAPLERARTLEASDVGFERGLWDEMAKLGWISLALPDEEHGGLGAVEVTLVAEEMGHALVASPFVQTVMAAWLIGSLGDPDQRRRWLPGIANGAIVVTVAIAEPESRSLWEPPRLAPLDGRLTGRKSLVPFAGVADLLLVMTAGPAVVAVEGNASGLVCRRERALGGEPLHEVELTGVACEPIAGGAAGGSAVAGALDRGAVTALAYVLGACERVVAMTVDHARTREQFGRPIGSFQAVAHRCADMRADVDAMRVLVQQAAWCLATGRSDDIAIASALVHALPAARRVFRHAHQVHGAIGFAMEHDLQLFTRRVKAAELTWGPAALHEERVARAMGVG